MALVGVKAPAEPIDCGSAACTRRPCRCRAPAPSLRRRLLPPRSAPCSAALPHRRPCPQALGPAPRRTRRGSPAGGALAAIVSWGTGTAYDGGRAACDGGRAACDGRRAACDGGRAAWDGRRTACDGGRAACDRGRAACDGRRTACDGGRAACDGRRAACDGDAPPVMRDAPRVIGGALPAVACWDSSRGRIADLERVRKRKREGGREGERGGGGGRGRTRERGEGRERERERESITHFKARRYQARPPVCAGPDAPSD